MATLTAKQLIEVLQSFPPDTEVFATWDGLYVEIHKDNINIEDEIYKRGNVSAIVIDVSEY